MSEVKRYAVIKNQTVVNIIKWDGLSSLNIDGTTVDLTENPSAQIGDSYADNVFSPALLATQNEITSYEFFNLFTKEERVAIRTAAKSSVDLEDWLSLAQAAQTIDLAHPDVDAGLSMIVGAGLLTSDRKTQILNNGV